MPVRNFFHDAVNNRTWVAKFQSGSQDEYMCAISKSREKLD